MWKLPVEYFSTSCDFRTLGSFVTGNLDTRTKTLLSLQVGQVLPGIALSHSPAAWGLLAALWQGYLIPGLKLSHPLANPWSRPQHVCSISDLFTMWTNQSEQDSSVCTRLISVYKTHHCVQDSPLCTRLIIVYKTHHCVQDSSVCTRLISVYKTHQCEKDSLEWTRENYFMNAKIFSLLW